MALGSLWQLADLPDMPSAPTLRAMIRERADFPVIQRGGRGVEYILDLDEAAAFVRLHWRDRRCELSGIAKPARGDRERLAAEAPSFFDVGKM